VTAYPHKFAVNTSIPAFVSKYHVIRNGCDREADTVAVAGDHAVRSSSSKLQFYDLHGESAKIQVSEAWAQDEEEPLRCRCALPLADHGEHVLR